MIQPLSDVYRPILGGLASSVHTPDEPALSFVRELVSESGEPSAGSSITLHLPAEHSGAGFGQHPTGQGQGVVPGAV